MKKTEVNVPIKIVYILAQIIETFLYKKHKGEDGVEVIEDRDIPFRLRYRLVRNKVPLERYIKRAESSKLFYLAQFGEPNADNTNVLIENEEDKKKYFDMVKTILEERVDLSIIKCEEDDVDAIKDLGSEFSNDMIEVLIAYMINDQALLDNLIASTQIEFGKNGENINGKDK